MTNLHVDLRLILDWLLDSGWKRAFCSRSDELLPLLHYLLALFVAYSMYDSKQALVQEAIMPAEEELEVPLETDDAEKESGQEDGQDGVGVTDNNNVEETPRDVSRQGDDALQHEKRLAALHVFGPAYARNRNFWVSIIFSTIPLGLFMALVALAFIIAFEQLSRATWLNIEYENALHVVDEGGEATQTIDILLVGNGEWWYVGLLTGSGLCVGLLKVLWTYVIAKNHPFPEEPPNMFYELKELRPEDAVTCIPFMFCSALSIGMGASVGPEAALGCVGIAAGSSLVQFYQKARRWTQRRFKRPSAASTEPTTQEERESGGIASYLFPDLTERDQLCALDGMAAGFGALFPTQYLSPMVTHQVAFILSYCFLAKASSTHLLLVAGSRTWLPVDGRGRCADQVPFSGDFGSNRDCILVSS